VAFQHREGQGALFKNERRTSDNHPNLRGQLMIGGVLYDVSAWRKKGSNGKPDWLSLQAKPAREQGQRSSGGGERRQQRDDDFDIPY
jgi:hypothetical protein